MLKIEATTNRVSSARRLRLLGDADDTLDQEGDWCFRAHKNLHDVLYRLCARFRYPAVGSVRSLHWKCSSIGRLPTPLPLDVQILDVERIVLDELPARFYVFSHESGEDGVRFCEIFELDPE
jgi:hypothetical protein